MNQMVDPCENFYEFVCGSFSTSCPVSDSLPFCNIDTEIDDRIKNILRGRYYKLLKLLLTKKLTCKN